MRTRLAFVFALLAACGPSWAQSKQAREAEILRFIERYDYAWNHKDATAVERVLASDYVYFSSKGQVRSRQSLLAEFLSPKYTLASAERSELKVYLTMDTAMVSSRWKGHGTYDGHQFNDDQRCSIVLNRTKQGWQVLSEHCTQIVAP